MTPYEFGQALLAVADSLIVDPPDLQYVTVGETVTIPPDCPQLVVNVSRLIPSKTPQPAGVPAEFCTVYNLVSACVRVARCFPRISVEGHPKAEDMEQVSAVMLDDGSRLYLGLTADALADTGCQVMAGPEITWERPSGGMVVVKACLTFDVEFSAAGS